MHQVRDRLNFFKEKYQQDFEDFSVCMKRQVENFEHFDDYMEWKAYTKLSYEVLKRIEGNRSLPPTCKLTRDSFPRYKLTHSCNHVERKAVPLRGE